MNQPAQGKAYYLPQREIEMADGEFEEYIDPKMAQENEEFEKFKSEMHDAQFDAKITVGKKLTDSGGRPLGRQVFECFECGIDDYTFSQLCTRIREDFGTGLYKIQGRDSNGKFKFDKTVGILAPNTTDNPPANDVGGLIDKFSDAMQRQQIRTEEMFKSLMGPQSGGDAFDQMTKMMTAMGGMMGAMGLKPQEPVPQKTMLEIMTEFKMMQELFGDSGGVGGEANLYSLLTATMQSFGAPIAAALAAGQADGRVNPQGLLENPKPAPVDQEKIKQEQETEALKAQIKLLVANAEAETSPEMMAELIVEKTPEDSLDSLFEFLSGDDYLDQMIFLVPEVKAHKNWFIKLRDTVLELLTNESDNDEYHQPTGLHGIKNTPIVPESETVAEPESVAEDTGSDISDTPTSGTDGDASTDTGGSAGN